MRGASQCWGTAAPDEWETDAYSRVTVALNGVERTWIYAKRPDPHRPCNTGTQVNFKYQTRIDVRS